MTPEQEALRLVSGRKELTLVALGRDRQGYYNVSGRGQVSLDEQVALVDRDGRRLLAFVIRYHTNGGDFEGREVIASLMETTVTADGYTLADWKEGRAE